MISYLTSINDSLSIITNSFINFEITTQLVDKIKTQIGSKLSRYFMNKLVY